ncbi:MAG: hypothetical protein RJA57_1966 [Bacteroidota bacterium]|jgi:hypothetical protein
MTKTHGGLLKAKLLKIVGERSEIPFMKIKGFLDQDQPHMWIVILFY